MAVKKPVTPTKSNVALPAGFEHITSGDFAQIHDFKTTPIVQGIVSGKKSLEMMRGSGKNKKMEPVAILTVTNSDTGEITSIFESSALEGVINEAKVGDEVYIAFKGVKKLPGKKTLKEYITGLKRGKPTK